MPCLRCLCCLFACPDDEDNKSLNSRENYVYVLYLNLVINTSVGVIAKVNCGLVFHLKPLKEAVLIHLF